MKNRNNKTVDFSVHTSKYTLNIYDLNSPIKRNCQSRLTKNKQKKECQQCVFYKKPLEVDTVRNEER